MYNGFGLTDDAGSTESKKTDERRRLATTLDKLEKKTTTESKACCTLLYFGKQIAYEQFVTPSLQTTFSMCSSLHMSYNSFMEYLAVLDTWQTTYQLL